MSFQDPWSLPHFYSKKVTVFKKFSLHNHDEIIDPYDFDEDSEDFD